MGEGWGRRKNATFKRWLKGEEVSKYEGFYELRGGGGIMTAHIGV